MPVASDVQMHYLAVIHDTESTDLAWLLVWQAYMLCDKQQTLAYSPTWFCYNRLTGEGKPVLLHYL